MFGRPLGRLIDRDNNVEDDEGVQPYLLQVICRPKSEKAARAQIVRAAGSNDITLRGIHTGKVNDDDLDTVRAAGFSEAQIVEVVAFSSQVLMTNFMNTVACTEIDIPVAA